MIVLRIVILCFMACACTGVLAHVIKNYYELVYSKVSLAMYCIYTIGTLFYTLLFWAGFFHHIAPYVLQ